MKIDIFAHICPKRFLDTFAKRMVNWGKPLFTSQIAGSPVILDIDKRLEVMDRYEDYVQVLIPTGGPVETFCKPKDATYLARIFNDEMADLLGKYPDKFVGAVACLPLNDLDETLKEIDRTITQLGFKGILMNTPIYPYRTRKSKSAETGYDYENMKPIDSPEFLPIYESMSKHGLPIWIHPKGAGGVPVYRGEKRGRYELAQVLGWPIESAMAMSRLVCSGVLEKYPNLRFITHHCGSGIIPALAGRIEYDFNKYKTLGMKMGSSYEEDPFKVKSAIDYFRMFYADTALHGDMYGLMCGHAFFGAEHMLFGTDFPYDLEGGDRFVRTVMNAIYRMNISDVDKKMIFEENAKRILRLKAGT